MMPSSPTSSTSTGDGWLCGAWRKPTNNSHHESGTIHDDVTARELGFRGGTIAGSIHMEQFLPLCVQVFGEQWQQHGSLSLYFTHATVDHEAVQARITCDESKQAVEKGCVQRKVCMVAETGNAVLEGTVALGVDKNSAVQQRLHKMQSLPPAKPRMLARVNVGFSANSLPTIVPQRDIDARLSIITEPRAEFSDPAIYGSTVAPLSAAVHAMRVFESTLPVDESAAVGMFGAIDWQYLDGPVFADTPYLVDGRVVAIGESPKTELLWYSCVLRRMEGTAVARMLLLSRLLKESSPLWR
jgi:hypothetical protein